MWKGCFSPLQFLFPHTAWFLFKPPCIVRRLFLYCDWFGLGDVACWLGISTSAWPMIKVQPYIRLGGNINKHTSSMIVSVLSTG